MPGGDRTGPMGEGPQSGRGMGFCSGNNRPGYMSGFGGGRGRGAGMGRGFGRGFWWGNRYPAAPEELPMNSADAMESTGLRAQVQSLQNQLSQLIAQVEKLSGK